MNYNSCRWCKYFDADSGTCCNSRAFKGLDSVIQKDKFWEEGVLSEAIQEGFNIEKFCEVEKALSETKLSKKLQREIIDILMRELEDKIVNWREHIDERVSIALKNFDFTNYNGEEGVVIVSSMEFSCIYFE